MKPMQTGKVMARRREERLNWEALFNLLEEELIPRKLLVFPQDLCGCDHHYGGSLPPMLFISLLEPTSISLCWS
jgi:hypothetical protein